jgi:hypothetical protein
MEFTLWLSGCSLLSETQSDALLRVDACKSRPHDVMKYKSQLTMVVIEAI